MSPEPRPQMRLVAQALTDAQAVDRTRTSGSGCLQQRLQGVAVSRAGVKLERHALEGWPMTGHEIGHHLARPGGALALGRVLQRLVVRR